MKSGIKELAKAYAKKYNVTFKEADTIIRNSLSIMKEAALDTGISVVGQFSIQLSEVAERKGVNPRTRESYIVPAHKTLKMKLGKKLKEELESL